MKQAVAACSMPSKLDEIKDVSVIQCFCNKFRLISSFFVYLSPTQILSKFEIRKTLSALIPRPLL